MSSRSDLERSFKVGYFSINLSKYGKTVLTWVCCNIISEIQTLYGLIFFCHGRSCLPKFFCHEIKFSEKINANLLVELEQKLNEKGFTILKDEKLIIVEKVKNLIHVKVANMTFSSEKFSDEISKNLGYNYSYVSRVFSANTGLTIEKYLLKCKIDKVKELIKFQKFSIKEIAYLLDYNFLSHLSNHFKRETGMTPSQFKKNISLLK